MTVSRVCYATREQVMSRLDIKLPARAKDIVDDAIEASSDGIDGGTGKIGGLCHRRFFPWIRTETFDYPDTQSPTAWRYWLNERELISATTVTSGGVTIASGDYFLRPDSGPPYNRIEINLAGTSAFTSGDTPQRALSILGPYGFGADEASAGTLAEALDASETGVDVSNSAAVGVGDLIRVDSERMLVVDKANVDTGQNLGGNLTAAVSDVSVSVSDGTAFTAGETITIDTERFRIDDITGNTLTVKRAWDGSVLAAHTNGADVYAPRTLTVTRGAYGTTAATHTTSTAVYRNAAPGLVRAYSRAIAIETVLQELAGYARTVGSGESERQTNRAGIGALRKEVQATFGRRARARAV